MIKIFTNELLQKPQAVIFDTDNTLYKYKQPHTKAMRAVIDKAYSLFGVSEKDFLLHFNKARGIIKARLEKTASSHSRLLYFQITIELLGFKSQVFNTLDLEETYWSTFLFYCKLFPDIREFIRDLKSINIKTGVITDLTSQIQFRKLIFFELDDYFDYVVTSEESGHDKPHESNFNILLNKLEHKKGTVIMIGDSYDHDIYGAKNNAILALQKIHSGVCVQKDKNLSDGYFSSYTDLRFHLKKYWA